MHMLIRGLVYAEHEDEALERAKHDVFHPLVEDRVFDYFVTFDEDGRGVSGSDRWGEYPVVEPVETDLGETLIERGWQATVDEYRRNFARVEEFFENNEFEEFWNKTAVYQDYILNFQRLGEFKGPSTFLYDQDGDGIRNRGHLEAVKDHWPGLYDSDPYENLDLFVVPADVHY